MKMKTQRDAFWQKAGLAKFGFGTNTLIAAVMMVAACSIGAPTNDNFTSAAPFTGDSATGSNDGATREGGEPAIGTSNDRPAFGDTSVWWKFTPGSSGGVTFRTRLAPGDQANDSGFDTQLGVFTGTNLASLVEVASDEDALSGANANYLGAGRSEVSFNAVAGTTYHIMVNGYQSATGLIKLYRVTGGGGGGGGGGGSTNGVLTVNVTGSGVVTPNLNGRIVPTGQRVLLTAVPARGFIFNGWSGSTTSQSARLSFTMQPGFNVTAHFVPNPFLPVRGNYNGLFLQPTGITHRTSGYVTFMVNDRGQYLGRLISNGRVAPFRGVFNGTGASTFSTRLGTDVVNGSLQLDLTGGSDQASGTVVGADYTAEIQADREVFNSRINPAPLAGQYNVVFTRDSFGTNGDGFGIVNVDGNGKARILGELADGSRFAQGTAISRNGQIPLYAWLYRGRGSVMGYLTVNSNEVTGTASWIKPVSERDRLYTNGINADVTVVGSRFVRTPGLPLANWTNAIVKLGGGNLVAPVTHSVALSSRNLITVTDENTDRLRLALSPAGVVRGSFVHPATGRPVSVQGILLQNADTTRGYFLGITDSGYLNISPGP